MAIAVETALSSHTNNDNESNWSGTDGADTYNVAIQGTNSESWLISKNTSETGTLTLSRDLSGTDSMFLFWMKSDLSYYYTSVKIQLISSAGNYREYTLALAASPYVSGDFKSFALDVNSGGTETGTFAPASLTSIAIAVDNSSSGNIRSVVNAWIDAMWYGTGMTFNGSSGTGDLMLKEAADLDDGGSEYGMLEYYKGKVFCQHNIIFDDNGSANTQKSTGEAFTFAKTANGISNYGFSLIGSNNSVIFNGTSIEADDTATFDFDSSGTVSDFDMTGGYMKKASSIAFKSGQDIDGVIFDTCGEIDTNGANMSNCTILGTTETSTGSLIINSSTEAATITDMQFKTYSNNSRYAVYVPSGVTSFTMDNWQFDDPNNTTDYALYWAGTGGTLTITNTNGTNLVEAGCDSAGGTVSVPLNQVTLTINVLDENDNTALENASVTIKAGDTTGGLPFEDTVTITRVSSTATVSHTAHGFLTGHKVAISGADQNEYNRIKTITVVDANSYTYTVTGTPTTPATGTILATAVIIDGLTNASGIISDTRSYSVSQSFTGLIQKGTGSDIYKARTTTGTIDKDNGLSQIILLTKD